MVWKVYNTMMTEDLSYNMHLYSWLYFKTVDKLHIYRVLKNERIILASLWAWFTWKYGFS